MRVTLDTNVVLSGLDGKDGGVLATLRRLHESGTIHIAVSSRALQDKHSDSDKQRMQRDLAAFVQLPRVAAPFRFDESYWDGHDVFCGEADGRVGDALERIFGVVPSRMGKRKNQLRDVDHLTAHWMARRDVFLTNDQGILDKATKLLQFGIRVMNPADFLKQHGP